MEMSVAEKSSLHKTASTLSRFLSLIPLGVMGTLPAASASVHGAAGSLPVGLSIAFSAFVTLVAAGVLQPLSFSGFPSLLPLLARLRQASGLTRPRDGFDTAARGPFMPQPGAVESRCSRSFIFGRDFYFVRHLLPSANGSAPATIGGHDVCPGLSAAAGKTLIQEKTSL